MTAKESIFAILQAIENDTGAPILTVSDLIALERLPESRWEDILRSAGLAVAR